MDAGKVGFTVLAPAGPGFSSRQVALKLSAALEQIQDGPVLTVHCEPEEQPTSTPSELFVVTPAQGGNSLVPSGLQLPAPGALPATGASMQFSHDVDIAAALASDSMTEFFGRAAQTFRHIVLSARCPQHHPETIVLTSMAQSLIMTALTGHTTQKEMRDTLAIFRASRAETIGFLMQSDREDEPGK